MAGARQQGPADRTRAVATATEPVRASRGGGPAAVPATFARSEDPLAAYLRAALDPSPTDLRWAIAVGRSDTPAADQLAKARDLLARGRAARDDLLIATGDRTRDALLARLAPLLADLLADLTDRQRLVTRLMIVDGLRQADVAERLGVARATISVMTARGNVRSISRLVEAIRILATG